MIPYDVIVIGAGVVGCAVARELSRYYLRVAVLDREYDVGEGTSKANSAILHSGFDAPVGSVEAALVTEGRRLWSEAALDLHLPIERVGAMVVALDPGEMQTLSLLLDKGRQNGVTNLRIVSRDEALHAEPHLNPAVQGGLLVPDESITDPFAAVIALAEHAAVNGVAFHLGCHIENITRTPSGYEVTAGRVTFATRWLINAAGLHSDDLATQTGRPGIIVRPRKGEFLVFDKPARALLSHILLPVPSKISKGILVAPTVFGGVLAGPTADDQDDKLDHTVTCEGLDRVRVGLRKLLPSLEGETAIATYAGLRAVGSTGDYLIDVDGGAGLVTISGIRSTGLTSALAIANRAVSHMTEAGLDARLRAEYQPERPKPAWIAGEPKPCLDPAIVARDGSFGRVVCLCERTSEGEVLGAMRSPVPATTMDAVKRRTWATAGRCQGYFCTAALLEVMARELSVPAWKVTKRGPGSEIISSLVNGGARRTAQPVNGARERRDGRHDPRS